ncbi:MAG: HEAT repeat domain-containing protein [Polyangiaceae bacterium]
MSDWSELGRALGADDAEERRRGTARLRDAGEHVPAELLTRALADSDWRVRKEAVLTAIALAPSPQVLEVLIAALGPGDNVGLRNAAVDALSGYGVHAIPPLARALSNLDADGKKLVVDVLSKSARPEGLPLLKGLLRDADVNVRGAAVEAVAAIGAACAEEAIQLLDACLDSPERFDRLAALEGLNRLQAVLPWERLEPLSGDPILVPALLVAAGRSGAADAAPLVLSELAHAHGRAFADALSALVELAQSSPANRERLRSGLLVAPPPVAAAILGEAESEDASSERRRVALLAAALLGSPEAAQVAVRALSDDSLAAQAEATLTELGSVAVEALVEGAAGAFPEQRAACVALLGPSAALDPDAAAAVKRALSDESPEVVAAALDALAAALDRSTLADARSLLDQGPLVRRAAQRALVTLARRYPDDATKLVAMASPGAAEAEAAAIVLEALGERAAKPEHVQFLTLALDGPHPAVRGAALAALSAIGGEVALGPVAFALTDEEPEVRMAAVRALGRLRDGEGRALGVERLLEVALAPHDTTLSATAVRALGEIGDERLLPVLRELVGAEPLVAVAAVEALSAIPSEDRRELVSLALAHPDAEVVKTAMRGLALRREDGAVSALATCLDHSAWEVRRLAAELLGGLGGDAGMAALRGRIQTESHDAVREALARALAEAETASGRRRTAPPPSLGGARRG